MNRFGIALLAALTLAAAAGAQTEYLIRPAEADPAISNWNDPHVVEIDRGAVQHAVLFVHLPGSFGQPESTKLLLQEAARNGYRAIGLSYPNTWTVDSLCDSSADRTCYEKVRMEIIDGEDRASLVAIPRPDSIEVRLAKLLAYLARQFPSDGWGGFLDAGGAPVWSRITISGHSQGGGEAAMLASVHRVNRVALFAAPKDFSSFFNAPAAWLAGAKATPIESYYGFCHTEDGAVRQMQIWTALGLTQTSAQIVIDGVSPPYGNSHMLFTRATPAQEGAYHGSVVVDRNTPLLPDGTPLFASVWQYMCFPAWPGRRRAAREP